jgi:hypothetical protein
MDNVLGTEVRKRGVGGRWRHNHRRQPSHGTPNHTHQFAHFEAKLCKADSFRIISVKHLPKSRTSSVRPANQATSASSAQNYTAHLEEILQAMREINVVDVVLGQLLHQRVQSVVDQLFAPSNPPALRLLLCYSIGGNRHELIQQDGLAHLRREKKKTFKTVHHTAVMK